MWNHNDPRETLSSGYIFIFTGEEIFKAFFDSKYESNYYIHTQSKYDKYKRIAPDSEIEEWPWNWMWIYMPKYPMFKTDNEFK